MAPSNDRLWLDSGLIATSDIRPLCLQLQTFRPQCSTHNHAAVELYLVLGGSAEWQRGADVGFSANTGRKSAQMGTAACSRGCSLTRGLDVKLFLDAPAGFTVLSAGGARPSA